jgi:type I restriction enzyme S subunit
MSFSGVTNYIFSTGFVVIRSSENVNKSFLTHFLKSNLFQDEKDKLCTGATQKAINNQNIEKLKFLLLPLATQKRIAEILDAADALRRKDQELLKKYDELAQGIFIDMFGDPVKNEKGWDVNKGRDVVKVLGGAAFKSTDYKDDGIPLIRIGTINKGYFDKSQIVFLPYDFAISHERYIVRPKDLLITLTGTVGKDDYGNVYVMEEHFNQYLLNQRVAKLVVKQDCLMTRFFEFLLKQKEIKAELTGVSRGVRQANISNEDIYNLDVITPPMVLQDDFVNRINSVYGQIEISTSSSLVSDILFNSLIQKAFKGELVA